MNHFVLWFTKLTAIPVQFFFYRKKLYFQNKEKQNTKIKGRALIVSNHISVYDYPLVMFTFFKRNIRVLIGEVMFTKNKLFSWFLKCLGGIKVNRDSYDFSFIEKSVDLLKKDKVVLIYPESRIPTPKEREEGLLEFKTSYIRIALESNSPIIPIYTNGKYGKDKKGDRARLIIGEKIYVRDLYDEDKSEKENIDYINSFVKNKIENLKINLERQIEGKNG